MRPPTYVPLRVHSHYSMLTGVDAPAELVGRCATLGLPALALADVNGLAGLVDFLQAAEASRRAGADVRPIVAAELSDGGARAGRVVALVEDEEGYRNLCRLIGRRQGTFPHDLDRRSDAGDDDFDLVAAVAEHHRGLTLLADHPRVLLGLYGRVPSERLLAAISPASLSTRQGGGARRGGWSARDAAEGARRNTHLAPVHRADVSDELRERSDDSLALPKCPPPASPAPALSLVEAARAIGVATVAVPDVYHAFPAGFHDHRTRVAIKHNALLEGLPPAWIAHPPAHLPTTAEMCALYADLPDVPGPWPTGAGTGTGAGAAAGAPGAVLRTLAVAERCRYTPPLGGVALPDVALEAGETAYSKLCTLAFEGARRRYQPLRPEVLRRLDYELSTIHQLGFAPYFLLVRQIADFARERGIPCVGRGSAADSLVAFALGLTDADPLRYRLPFERFLNPARRDRPDIDLDFCWRRRDEVLRHVFELFGRERTAMICTLNRFGFRSAFREAALALGIPPAEVNPWSKRLPMFGPAGAGFDGSADGNSDGKSAEGDSIGGAPGAARFDAAAPPGLPPHLARNPLALALWALPEARDFPFDDDRFARALEAAARLVDAPRHFGLHPGGVVVSPGPLEHWVACQRAAKEHPLGGPKEATADATPDAGQDAGDADRAADDELPTPERVVVTQLDKDGVEAIGLVKMDLLGNRALTTLADTLALLRAQGIEVDLHALPEDDERTAALLREGRTLGCFQIESPGMRNLLQQTGAATMDDVIQAVALIRPGPAGSGMKDAYIRRFRGLEPATPPHPRLVDVLWDTHGVMLYQEDVMQAAARVAGLDLPEADQLRRTLQKRREDLGPHRALFLEGCAREGIDRADGEHVWDLIANFASFAFCKAHAVTYGRIAYRAAWLKAHHPAPFLVAFLASETGYYPARVYVEEARRLGVAILGPDVNKSGATFDVEGVSPRAGGAASLALRVGLSQVKGISGRLVAALLDERARGGPFLSLPDFLERTGAHTDEAAALVQCGAFDAFDRTRPELLWRLHLLRTPQVRAPRAAGLDPRSLEACRSTPTQRAEDAVRAARARTGGWSGRGIGVGAADLPDGVEASLFPRPEPDAVVLPGLPDVDAETRGRQEFDLLGFCLGQHPALLFPCPADERLEEHFGRGAVPVHARFHSTSSPPVGAADAGPSRIAEASPVAAHDLRPVNPVPCGRVARFAGGRVTLRGWPAATRRVRTEAGELMRFLTLEDETGLAEVILFPDVYRRDGHRLAEGGVLCVTGVVEDQMGARNLRAERVW